MEVEKFTFLKIYADSISKLAEGNEQLAKDLCRKIVQYGIYGINEESNDPILEALFIQIKNMIDKGKEISRSKSKSGKSHSGNQYTQGDEKRKASQEAQKKAVEQNGTDVEQNWNEMEQHITYNIEHITDNIEQETINKKDMCEINSHDSYSFDKFWKLYPNRKDKKKAKISFERLSLIKKQLAIEGISKLKESDQRKKGFIPLPTTYLNGERREDEVESKNSRINEIQEFQRKARIEEAKKVLNHDINENATTDKNTTFNRRTEINSS